MPCALKRMLLVIGVALLTTPACVSHADDKVPPSVLELVNGDFVRGNLGRITGDSVFWDSDFFTRALEFPLHAVRGMKRAPRTAVPQGRFLIELNNRDVLFGDVLAIDERLVQVKTQLLGELSILRQAVRRIAVNQGNASVHHVPDRLEQWTTSNLDHWRMEGTSFVTDTTGASLYVDVSLPRRAAIELELAWKGKPNFALYLGTDVEKQHRDRAYSIEAWGKKIVAQRQSAKEADLAILQDSSHGSVHVYAYLDLDAHELIIYDTDGSLLAELDVPVDEMSAQSGIFVLNRQGNVRLKHLQIRGWSGIRPRSEDSAIVRVELQSEVHYGDFLELQAGQLLLRNGDDAVAALNWEDVRVVDLPASPQDEQPTFVAAYQDGSRVSGALISASDREILIRSAAGDRPWNLTMDSLRGFALAASKPATTVVAPPDEHRRGTLELMDTRLAGWLLEQAVDDVTASCLVWQPSLARGGSPLMRNANGRIVYRELLAPPPAPKPNRQRQHAGAGGFFRVLGFGNAVVERQAARQEPAARGQGESAVHLRSGDAIPCKILGIDEQGVRIESSLTESNLIPHAQVKAAQLIDQARMPRIAEEKRERLLTLPRMQRHSPPLHLLFSQKGDVLRGSVTSMREDELEMEIRLDPHLIPRHRVATIVWLHPDEIEGGPAQGAKPEPSGQDNQDQMFVQVVSSAGNRFSFVAQTFTDQTLYGTSDVLDAVHAKIGEIDQLLLGPFIHRAARSLPYHRWRLVAATNPKFVDATDDPTQESILGTESNLVGQPAPNVRLKMLDGEDFRMVDHRGHCVVLDFWATWCGPCLQVMPQVERVVAQFREDQVRLIAVNLEERPELIQAVLERRGVAVPVALDRDGVAAIRYEASSIPHTVVVGPDGTIERVFAGITPNFEQHLADALTAIVQAESESPSP